ncbi:hypothetical protein LTR66_012559 [Elasticomyces elasticus]|nr:hypothetical protein LTR66_012559 [Elasticomyces elasticus]
MSAPPVITVIFILIFVIISIDFLTFRPFSDRSVGRQWFDCAECHAEAADHPLAQRLDMVFACKKCKKCFRKDVQEFEESDEYCPHCDNHFIINAVTPQARLEVEGEDVRKDARMLKDERVRKEGLQNIFNIKGLDERLG